MISFKSEVSDLKPICKNVLQYRLITYHSQVYRSISAVYFLRFYQASTYPFTPLSDTPLHYDDSISEQKVSTVIYGNFYYFVGSHHIRLPNLYTKLRGLLFLVLVDFLKFPHEDLSS